MHELLSWSAAPGTLLSLRTGGPFVAKEEWLTKCFLGEGETGSVLLRVGGVSRSRG